MTFALALRVLAWRLRPLLLALGLVLACAAAARLAAPPPGPTAAVVVARADLAAGHALTADDLRTVRLPSRLAPGGAAADPGVLVGEHLAVDVPRGLPVVAAHLAGSRFARPAPPGTVAVPVHLADDAVAALLRPGDRVDLVAGADAWAPDPRPEVLAEAALVLEVRTGTAEPAGGLALGLAAAEPEPLVVVAVPPDAGHRIAAAAAGAVGAVLVQGS